MSLYSTIVFVHVAVAMATFGLAAIQHFALLRMRAARTTSELGLWIRAVAGPAQWLPIGAMLLLATGVYLTSARWPWSSGWVLTAVVGLLLVQVIGGAIAKPQMKQLGKALASQAGAGGGSTIAQADRTRLASPVLWTASHVNTGIVIGIVYLMEVKPALPLAIMALVVGAVVGAMSAVPFWRQLPAQPHVARAVPTTVPAAA